MTLVVGSMKLSSLQKNNMCVFMLMQRVGGVSGWNMKVQFPPVTKIMAGLIEVGVTTLARIIVQYSLCT